MLSGVVRTYDRGKGYGFITPDRGGSDVFIHKNELRLTGLEELTAGSAVWFDLLRDRDGFRAHRVSVLAARATSKS